MYKKLQLPVPTTEQHHQMSDVHRLTPHMRQVCCRQFISWFFKLIHHVSGDGLTYMPVHQ
jgi:hypothetical protein